MLTTLQERPFGLEGNSQSKSSPSSPYLVTRSVEVLTKAVRFSAEPTLFEK